MPTLLTPQLHPPTNTTQPALWFIFYQEQILLYKTPYKTRLPLGSDIAALHSSFRSQHYLGMIDDTLCFAAELVEAMTLPEDMVLESLRQAYELVNDESLFLIASRAKQILVWDQLTQFCGRCGQATVMSDVERAKLCSHCQSTIFPQIAPVVMALVWRDNEILLARSPHFHASIYSVLAGFVEPGETIEQTVAREVYEEVGLRVKNLRYFCSQPWPFPSNLMLAFTAEYASGEINIDPTEIEDAQWFRLDNLPQLPKPISLSRHLIDAWVELKNKR
jgi:NAD+ diphosphatase